MKLVQFLVVLGFALSTNTSFSQDVISEQGGEEKIPQRVWYKNYISIRLHPKWSIDNSLMFGLRSVKHDFAFVQIGVGVTHRFNKFWSMRAGYESTFFKHSNWWRNRYNVEPGVFNSVHFQSFSLNVKRRDNIGEKFRLTNTLEGKFFTPRYEKFQTRIRLGTHFGYRKKDLPWQLRPFVSASVYYYLNGRQVEYTEVGDPVEEGGEPEIVTFTAAPNGLHRALIRIGTSFKPFKAKKAPSFSLYYGFNREFNSGIGNELNIEPAEGTNGKVRLPFNNYGILGFQVNWFL